MKILTFTILVLLVPIVVFAEDVKVYTHGDLSRYNYGNGSIPSDAEPTSSPSYGGSQTVNNTQYQIEKRNQIELLEQYKKYSERPEAYKKELKALQRLTNPQQAYEEERQKKEDRRQRLRNAQDNLRYLETRQKLDSIDGKLRDLH